MFDFPSRWYRFPHSRSAQRRITETNTLLVTCTEDGQSWQVSTVKGAPPQRANRWTFPVSSALTLNDALELVDIAEPPVGWVYRTETRCWERVNAKPAFVVLHDEAENVWRAHLDGKTFGRRSFAVSDEARRWCEIRGERVTAGGALRGPRPRGAQVSNAKLPEARVTQEERKQAEALAKRLNLTNSDLARAAMRFLATHCVEGGALDLRMENGEPTFYLRPFIA